MWSNPGSEVAIEKGDFGLPLTTVTNFSFFTYIINIINIQDVF